MGRAASTFNGPLPAFSVRFRDDSLRHLEFMPDYTKPRRIAEADTLEQALQVADRFVERKMGRMRANQYVPTPEIKKETNSTGYPAMRHGEPDHPARKLSRKSLK